MFFQVGDKVFVESKICVPAKNVRTLTFQIFSCCHSAVIKSNFTGGTMSIRNFSASKIFVCLQTILPVLLVAASCAFFASFLWIAANRIGWPFENEWLEGDEFHHAWRIMRGLAWYPAPSIDFFPNVYAPGYAAVCALLMKLFGESLTIMRAVSIVSTITILFLIGCIVYRQTRSLFCSIIAGGVFMAAFEVCGAWFDIARVDMLALAVVLGAITLVHHKSSSAAFFGGSILLGLSYFCKQTNSALIVGTILVWFFWNWRRALEMLAITALLIFTGTFVLNRLSDGWYLFYTITVPSSAPIYWASLWDFFTIDINKLAGCLLPILGFGFWLAFRKRQTHLLPLLLFPFAATVSIVPHLCPGGYDNLFVTLAAFVAIGTGLSLGAIATEPGPLRKYRLVALTLIMLHFYFNSYNPSVHVLHCCDLDKGMAIVEKIRKLPGPVLCPYHPYLLYLAGQPMHMHFYMLDEIRIHKSIRPEYEKLVSEIGILLKKGYWKSYISSQNKAGQEMTLGLGISYFTENKKFFSRPGPLLFSANNMTSLFPATGYPIRPYRIYLDFDKNPLLNGQN